jgi:hypothetical protein
MSYTPRYTSLSSLMRKAYSRLKINDENGSFAYPETSINTNAVDENLVLDLIEENEDLLNSYLSQVYILPLQNKHTILKKCIDSLVLSDLMNVYFVPGGFGQSNDNGFAVTSRVEGLNIIRALTYNLNLYIPGIPSEQEFRNKIQALILPNETQRKGYRPSIAINSSTFVGNLPWKRSAAQEEVDDVVELFQGERRTRKIYDTTEEMTVNQYTIENQYLQNNYLRVQNFELNDDLFLNSDSGNYIYIEPNNADRIVYLPETPEIGANILIRNNNLDNLVTVKEGELTVLVLGTTEGTAYREAKFVFDGNYWQVTVY